MIAQHKKSTGTNHLYLVYLNALNCCLFFYYHKKMENEHNEHYNIAIDDFDSVNDNDDMIQIDVSTKEDDCEIHVMRENKFVDIQEIQHDFSFVDWWTSVAEQIKLAMYGSTEAKRSVIKLMMPLFDFKYEKVEPLRLLSNETYDIYTMYKEKLKLYELKLLNLKNFYCEILRNCAMKCKSILLEQKAVLSKLQEKVVQFHSKYKDSHPRYTQIIKEEYQKITNFVNKDYLNRFVMVKLEYTFDKYTFNDDALKDISKKIATHKLSHDSNVIRSIENAFLLECKNIEFDIAKQIQNECQQNWMEALT